LLAWFPAAARTNDALVGEVQELHVSSKHEAIRVLVRRLGELDCISPEASDAIVAKIMAREELGATGIGRGVAIPHAKHPSVRRTVGIVGYTAQGIDFNSLDGEFVRTIVLLLSPNDKPVEHLRALEWISRTLRDVQPQT
jgi:PTS system fructose-specific IIA component/PTS system nitrogen regulatory IIA component